MNPLELARIGTTDLKVTRLGLGGGQLGGAISDVQAITTIATALQLGIRYIDTAPLYGLGKSESRIGNAISDVKPQELVISTKVGRILRAPIAGQNGQTFEAQAPYEAVFDFSRSGILHSLETSMSRLGRKRADIVLIHDPDDYFDQAMSEAYETLRELKSTGVVTAIGAGMNQWEMELKFAQKGKFDCFLLAGKYTLIDQSAADIFLPYCVEKNISVIIGAPFYYGLLVSDLGQKDVNPELIEKVRRISAVCSKHAIPLKAAALQFVLAHPAVAAVIPGSRSPQEMSENFQMLGVPIPCAFWEELLNRKLISPKSVLPLQ